MTVFLLDTGIVLGYVRGAGFAEYVERKYSVSQPPNIALISVVSVGELYSLAFRRRWEQQKRDALTELIRKIPAADINNPQVLMRYAEIEAFSQGYHPSQSLPRGLTSRNMNKNDLWIAATASVLKATLLTTDHDFDHLHEVFLSVEYIDQKLKGQDADG